MAARQPTSTLRAVAEDGPGPAAAAGQDRLEAQLSALDGVIRAAVRRLGPRGLGIPADEVAQDVRIRLWRALQHERNEALAASYVWRAAVSATIDAVRRVRARREQEIEGADGPGGVALAAPATAAPDRQVEAAEIREKVETALGQLNEARRRAVRLHLQGFGTKEVADLLGWTEAKARNLVYRGLEDLRSGLRGMGVELEAD
jgi:RNA polymerase sigma-70 factor (ECF subfamily)